jgi:small-conductance mechanosensitive channel
VAIDLNQTVFGMTNLRDLIIFLAWLGLTVLVAQFVFLIVRARFGQRQSANMARQSARMFQYAILGIGLYIGIWIILKLDFSTLLLSLGIIGIAVAFAAQQIIGNILAGIIISLTRQAQVDDWVEVGGGPTTGLAIIKEINLMSTILRDMDGRVLYVPNAFIITNKLVNYSKEGYFAIEIPLWIASLDAFDKIEDVVLEEADRHPLIMPGVGELPPPPFRRLRKVPGLRSLMEDRTNNRIFNPTVDIIDIQAGKVRILIRVWIKEVGKKDAITTEFLSSLHKRFGEGGIALAGP